MRRVWVFFAVFSYATSLLAQETVAEWEDDVQLWEEQWDEIWWGRPTGGRLTVTLGRKTGFSRSGLLDETLLASEFGAPVNLRGRAEYYAMAGVEVPWGVLLRGGRSGRSGRSAPQRPSGAGTEVRLAQSEVRDRETAKPSEPAGSSEPAASSEKVLPAPSSEPSRRADSLRTSVEEDKEGPSEKSPPASSSAGGKRRPRSSLLHLVREVMLHVETAQGFQNEQARMARLVKRSRRSGLVPELRLRGVYGFDQTTSLADATGIYPGETTTRGGRDSLAEVRLAFRLDRLVYGDQETTLERHRTTQKEAQKKVAQTAVDLVLKWWQAERATENPELLPDEHEALVLRAEQALVSLYLLTDGWFRGRETLRALGLSIEPLEGHLE